MPNLGQLALAIALILALYSIAANIYGARRNATDVIVSARHAIWAMTAMVAIAAVSLWVESAHQRFLARVRRLVFEHDAPDDLQNHLAMGRAAGVAAAMDAAAVDVRLDRGVSESPA